MTCQVMLLFLNGKKIARRLIKINFVPRKVNSSTRGKDRKGNHFNVTAQDKVYVRYMTKHIKHMLSNFLNIHHDLPSYVIVPEREKNSKTINQNKFCTTKS